MRLRMLVPVAVIIVSVIVIVTNVTSRRSPGIQSLPIRPELEPDDPSEELAELSRRIETVKASIEAHRVGTGAPPSGPSAKDAPSPGEAEPAAPDWPEVPREIVEAGATMGVPPPVLEIAFRLDHATREKLPFPGGLERLVEQGPDGFVAVVAVIRGGLRATWQREWLRELYEPGLERHLIDLAEAPGAGRAASFALWLLGIADTEEVRNYLVARAARATSARDLYHLADALGDLAEPRGAAAFEGKFAKEGFSGVRGDILSNLGRMGGSDARRILIDYLRTEHADRLGRAARALARMDPVAAREEAARLLAGPDAGYLPRLDRIALGKIAGE